MDLLAGYGSDASDSGSEEEPAPTRTTAAPTSVTEPAPAAPAARARPSNLDDAFGAAFGGGLRGKPAFGGLPAPGASAGGAKRLVSFMAPLKPLSKEELEVGQVCSLPFASRVACPVVVARPRTPDCQPQDAMLGYIQPAIGVGANCPRQAV